jgi:diguanylate cyclase (GGDEF)-like protein/PAS domain S-box-containing protein
MLTTSKMDAHKRNEVDMGNSTPEDLARSESEQLVELQAAALKAAPNAIVITDRGAKIVWVNNAFEQLTGYSSQEVVGQSTRLLQSGQHSPSFYTNLWDTILSGSRWQGALVNRRKDGTLYSEEMSITPVRDRAGDITHFVAIKRDITESKNSERELLVKTVLLEAQAEATLDGILAVDEANKIILSNQRFAIMWCLPPALVSRRSDKQVLQFVTDQIEDPKKFLDRVEHLYNHREEKSRDELRLKDGRFVDRYSSPLIDKDGAYRGRIWYFRDVTTSKQAEEKLRASEEQFRQLAENIREVFFIIALEPVRVTYTSPAYEQVWGRPCQEVYDRPGAWMESVNVEDRERVGAYFARCLQGIQSELQYRITRPDGSVRWIHSRSFPVRDATGKFLRLVGIAEDITVRTQEEKALADANQRLNVALRKAEEQAHDSARLTELIDVLQSCQTVDEAYSIATGVLPGTFSCRSGALCITSASRNVVEAVSVWGAETTTEKAFKPDDCWALRRGKIHMVKDSTSPMRCAHVKGLSTGGYLCIPLAAQGETLGVMCLECPPASASSSSGTAADPMAILEHQAIAVGERLSLALANLRLREALRCQSVRDPLTGLFNRRFMEESLERELGRATRGNQTVVLVMLDIDHFKHFNDTFGHQAGDTLLRALGDFLKQRTRGQDVACRYGGEEFAFLLAGASIDAAYKRAQVLREELKQLQVQHGGQLLGSVTLSMGIAAFPTHASNAETLVKAADKALYQAKKEGRDRIIVAPPPKASAVTA